jgi:hypothetical protein
VFNTFINSNPGTWWLIMGMSPVWGSNVAGKMGATDASVVAPYALSSEHEDLGTNFTAKCRKWDF